MKRKPTLQEQISHFKMVQDLKQTDEICDYGFKKELHQRTASSNSGIHNPTQRGEIVEGRETANS